MIHLSLGALQIDWGKNDGFANHQALFQESDLGIVPDYGYSPPLEMDGYSRRLGDTLARIELLGYSLNRVKKEFEEFQDEWGESVKFPLSFKKLLALI
jgi:hypothetical protein